MVGNNFQKGRGLNRVKLDAETIIPNVCYLNVSLFQKIVLYILHCYNVDKANVIFMDSLTEY